MGFHKLKGDESILTSEKVMIGINILDLIILEEDLKSIEEVKNFSKNDLK